MFRPLRDFEDNEGSEAHIALREGLHGLPVPSTSADFDARIHAALSQPTPWWRSLLPLARPVLSTAACSLLVTLALLKGLSGIAASHSPQGAASPGEAVAYGSRDRLDALESSDFPAGLNGFGTLSRPLPARQSQPKESPHPAGYENHS